LVGRQPFGGHRLSGVGAKAGGTGYLKQFMVMKVISENTLRRGFAPSE
jgi:RHH-type proline utilization regulon transcriptional repressor/proline dehydrogenase/delta 1-pyrroline-5-carboxylate dehydrogenase